MRQTCTLCGILLLITSGGCSMLGNSPAPRRFFPGLGLTSKADTGSAEKVASSSETTTAENPVRHASGSLSDRLGSSNKLVGYVTGTYQNLPKAKELYQQGDKIFRSATNASKAERVDLFAEAADYFDDAADEAPGSALHQDALFMRGESLFFANDLNGARDAFETLQKDFPRNRHSDRAAARLFSISQFWIDVSKAGSDQWYTINFFDSTRPMRDAQGHAVKVLDQIRYDDPTGKLADDATMAAAVEYIRNEDFERADEFLTDLRETFSDSDHLFIAHLMGIRCKLSIYRGPAYSFLVIDEADKLVQQTRRRFPDKLRDPKYNEMIARAAAEVEYHKAEKLAYRARFRTKQKNYGAARDLYRKILRDHSTTPQAEEARSVLAKIEEQPASPTRNFAFLAKAFPSAKQSPPLKLIESEADTPAPNEGKESDSSVGKTLIR